MTLAGRDVRLRYRQTALGAIWVFMQPLLAAMIFAFVFGRVAKMPTDGFPAIVFTYAGMWAWNAFSSTLTKSSMVLVQNANLVSKVFFPRLVLPLSTVFSSLLDFIVSALPMAALMLAYKVAPGPQIVFMPIALLLLLMLSTGVGLYASALMVAYRDVQYVIPVIIQMLTFACPIGYAVSKVPAEYQTAYYLNPLVGLMETFRWSIIGGTTPNLTFLAYSTAFSVLVFIGGAFSFKKMERRFADVI
jgi:lipopolysaccharide transport system permease protein